MQSARLLFVDSLQALYPKVKYLQSRTQETMTCMPSAETRLLCRTSEHLLLDSLLSLFRKERTKQMTIEYNFL